MTLTTFRPAFFLAAIAAVSLTGTAAFAAGASAGEARLASTPAEHAAAAKNYRMQAEAFTEEAVTHERHAAQLAASAPAIVHKWPAATPGPLGEVKQKAVAARRAALENHQLAQRHVNLAIEAQVSEPRSAD